ncbi:MAG: glycosyltransferase family 2 protein [Simkaniaceae bacterium]|nr:glycosyltransferase family 2 protein [Simkaniaceae bacterium]
MNRSKIQWLSLSIILPILIVAIILGQHRHQKRADIVKQNYAVKMLNISDYKPFTVVICSYNNAEYIEKNFSSALSQVYPNYRIIYIDDASTDDTLSLARSIMERYQAQAKVTLISNASNQGAMANTYRAIHSCPDDEIIVMLDGDDYFAHPNVLSELNQYYNNPDTWLTYGQCQSKIDRSLGKSSSLSHFILKSGRIKKKAWMTSHPRTFYAGLFKRIKLSDLTHNGAFLPMGADVAAMLPMIEMAREHAVFIRDVLYVYNDENPINDHKKSEQQQEFFNQYIRELPTYSKLKNPPWETQRNFDDLKSDVMVFSYNRPMQLYAFLESLTRYAKNVGNVYVIYRASNDDFEMGYTNVKSAFGQVKFIRQNEKKAKKEFKPMVMKYAFNTALSSSKYITFSTDDLVLKDEVDFAKGIQSLERSQAYGFFYRLGQHIDYCYMIDAYQGVPDLMDLGADVYAWEFEAGQNDWKYPNSVDFTLYRKADIESALAEIHFTIPYEMEGIWASKADFKKWGLCHRQSRIVNIPLNLVSNPINRAMNTYSVEILLKKFLEGQKIDLKPLHQIENRSPHMEYEPTFVMRFK